MKNAVILHAMDDNPNNHWYPWLKSNLEERGYEVWLPQLPDDKNPQIDVWVPFILNGAEFTGETVVIGHSAGAAVILSLLEAINVKVKQAIMVAGFCFYPDGDANSAILEEAFSHGLHLADAGDCTQIMPPLTISQEALEQGISILIEAIKKVK